MENENKSTSSVTLESDQPSLESAAPVTQELQTNISKNKKKLPGIYLLVLITIIFIVLGGIGYYLYQSRKIGSPGWLTVLEPKAKLADIKNVVVANNQFALNYYSHLKERERQYLFFTL